MNKVVSYLVLFVLMLKTVQLNNRLNVEVLFESLCPDSQRFIQQLYSSWPDIGQFINIKFVPFGKSSSLEEGTKFVCQHGPLECKGNRIMSCALNELNSQTAQMEYVACFMIVYSQNKYNVKEFGELCARRVGLNFENVRNCYETKRGTELQLQAEQETLRFKPTFVPTIVYNNQFNQNLQDESVTSFKATVCKLIQHQFPEAC